MAKGWGGGGGGAVLREGRHIDNECLRSQGRIQKAGGGGGGVLSVLGPIRKVGRGGRAACRTMIYILVCKHVRDSAWGVERGGGGGGGG